ncbi:TolC family protein [Sulfurimonas sp.]|uniref:TolC family protein n=1 Tax=Sulfurimonas sp. TaxID=2022749 RepID=UPI002624FEDA|nr:TolC family protein [Sulfurimonas sp.]MCW8895813.1 TolC family protein [Sulfurimonas sp.]MCW9067810.1 TolC family protein [Sulfurimonas sp.]
MTKFLTLYLYVFVFLLSAKELTLDECIDKTLKNHPDIKNLTLNVEQSGHLVDIAKADYLPQINIGAQYNPINTFVMPQNGQFKTIEDDNWQFDAKINQKIYDFSRTTSNIKASKKNENIANISLDDAKALLIYNVKNLYNLALFQTNALKARQKDLQTKNELYKQAQALVKEGLKTEADATSILSAMYIAEDTLAITKADLNKALSTLSLYMGEKVDFETKLVDNTALQNNQALQNEDLLFQDILEKNFTLKSSKEEIERNDLIYSATKAQNYGSIDAVASYTHQDSINEYDTSLVGISINIPIYSGGRISAQTQEALISKKQAKESYNSKKLLIQEELENLIIDFDRYKHTIKAKKALIESSMLTKEIVQARYKEGLSTYIEILDATSTNLYAELGLLEAKFAVIKIINRLDYLQGQTK